MHIDLSMWFAFAASSKSKAAVAIFTCDVVKPVYVF